MWPFKHKQAKLPYSRLPCPHCGSINTSVTTNYGSDTPDVRAWRGQRYVNWKCPDCGQTFYADETGGLTEDSPEDRKVIEDEDELQAAEEEVKKQTDEEGDRRYKIDGF